MHMHAGRDGVDANLGARAMAALALKRDTKTVHARERRAAVEHQPSGDWLLTCMAKAT